MRPVDKEVTVTNKEPIQKTALRLPVSLHKRIIEAAEQSGRTMNAEIVYRLEQSFEHKAEILGDSYRMEHDPDLGERLESVEKTLELVWQYVVRDGQLHAVKAEAVDSEKAREEAHKLAEKYLRDAEGKRRKLRIRKSKHAKREADNAPTPDRASESY